MVFLGPGLKANSSGFLGPIAVLREHAKPASKINGKKWIQPWNLHGVPRKIAKSSPGTMFSVSLTVVQIRRLFGLERTVVGL